MMHGDELTSSWGSKELIYNCKNAKGECKGMLYVKRRIISATLFSDVLGFLIKWHVDERCVPLNGGPAISDASIPKAPGAGSGLLGSSELSTCGCF